MPNANYRREPRLILSAPTLLSWRGERRSGSGTVSNMSKVGCYVLTSSPMPLGDEVYARIEGLDRELHASVRYVDPYAGMGIAWLDVTTELRDTLLEFLRARAVHPSEQVESSPA